MAHWQTWQMKHFVCFCVSTGSSPNTSLLSDQKGLAIFDVVCGESCGGGGEREAEEVSSSDIQLRSSVTQRSVCWEIIWHLVLDTSRRWVEKEGRKKEAGEGGRRDRRQRVMGQRGKGEERGRGKWECERERTQSIQKPRLHHVIACQHRFKNKAFERPSRATVWSMLWKCWPRCHWHASDGHSKRNRPLCDRMTGNYRRPLPLSSWWDMAHFSQGHSSVIYVAIADACSSPTITWIYQWGQKTGSAYGLDH